MLTTAVITKINSCADYKQPRYKTYCAVIVLFQWRMVIPDCCGVRAHYTYYRDSKMCTHLRFVNWFNSAVHFASPVGSVYKTIWDSDT